MRILAIETSCDETSLALVEARGGLKNPRFKILKNLVASQIKIHRPFGGVVPNLAKREHMKNLPALFKSLNAKSSILNSVDLIAVTVGPGLEPALWTGINFAKSLINADQDVDERRHKNIRKNLSKYPRKSAPTIVGANHLEGHLYSFLLPKKQQKTAISKVFPAVALIVSGGHTILLKLESLKKWKKLAETRDDAAGEAFDKVARLLNLPYPGGPEIEKIARRGNPAAINFPRPMINDKSYDFSFSGLKTAVLYHLRGQNSRTNADGMQIIAEKSPRKLTSSPRRSADAADIAASFQQAVVDVLVAKTIHAAKEFKAKSILLSGGVAANKKLRRDMRQAASNTELSFLVPDFKYNLDNAAMIAVAGYMAYLRKKRYKLTAQGGLDI